MPAQTILLENDLTRNTFQMRTITSYLVYIILEEQMTETYREALFAGVAPHQLHVHSPERLWREARSTPSEPHEAALIFSAHGFDYLHVHVHNGMGTSSATSGYVQHLQQTCPNLLHYDRTSKELRYAHNMPLALSTVSTDECSRFIPTDIYYKQ